MTVPAGNIVVGIIEDLSPKDHQVKIRNRLLIWCLLWWRAIFAEFLSTMFLVLIGCMACIPSDEIHPHPPIYGALGFGFAVLFTVQAFGHISGAHMNPCVSLTAVLWNKISLSLGVAYVIAQCLGSIFGYGILMQVSPTDLISNGICTTQPHEKYTVLQTFGVELILTSSLIFLVCAIWDPLNSNSQGSISLKFGFVVAGLSIAGGPLTGASLNPARSLGPALWTGVWTFHWVYWTGPLVASMVVALFYKYTWLKPSLDVKDSAAYPLLAPGP
ncbi:aquaporin-4 [Papilio machaon]|uniref:aquaporin-4 n=1 Tax=Papilio machaon TaxID=76193 RepID=UPI001E664803|nr:aquaporin-4 [Papilio machaon]